MQWNPTQLLSLLHLSSLPSSQPNILPPVQPTFTRRTNGHCLGTFIAVNLALFPPVKCSVSHYPPTFSSLYLRLQRVDTGLQVQCQWYNDKTHREVSRRIKQMPTELWSLREGLAFSKSVTLSRAHMQTAPPPQCTLWRCFQTALSGFRYNRPLRTYWCAKLVGRLSSEYLQAHYSKSLNSMNLSATMS
jgi:hypothetical protein